MCSARFVDRSEVGDLAGLVIVIDVLRAFTTAAVAFDRGATSITLVADADEALALGRAEPGAVVMGEVGGAPVDGFDLGNSPVDAASFDFRGRRVVQRTSAGTQGVVAARVADVLLCGSLVVAGATARLVRSQYAHLARTYVITGRHNDEQGSNDGGDDLAVAEYLEALITTGDHVDARPFVERVRQSQWARVMSGIESRTGEPMVTPVPLPGVHPGDLDACCEVDRYALALQVDRSSGRPVLHSVTHPG